MVQREIEIQIKDAKTGFYEPISFKKIQHGLESIIVSGDFRILVNGKIVYPVIETD